MMMNSVESNANMYNNINNNNNAQFGMGYRGVIPATATAETLIPMYSCVMAAADSFPQKTTQIKSESGLSYNHHLSNNNPNPNPPTRKRSRESMNLNPNHHHHLLSYGQSPSHQINKTTTATTSPSSSPLSFLGHDVSLQIHQQQLDIDNLVSQHMEKVRIELEEKRKRQARRIIETIEEGMLKRLRAKEDEIDKIGKLNWALEERVKSLCIENQIWRDLAQSNEATANALRSNLEQVLAAQVKDERTYGAGLDESVMDDAQSCCGSSGGGDDETEEQFTSGGRLTLAAQDKDTRNGRLCRNCRREESCVLLLPCRHLCLCTVCGSSLNTCPICKATKNASFHVNMS